VCILELQVGSAAGLKMLSAETSKIYTASGVTPESERMWLSSWDDCRIARK
jgi:hypothetical protein